jgi:uncharacterized surface anchored protein
MRRLVTLIALMIALALPAQAFANGGISPNASGAHQYHRVDQAVEQEEAQPPAPTQPAQTLPFTGEDILLVVLTGLLLAAGGLTLYRQVKHR